MHQLVAHDAAFLYSDNAHANSNISLLHIYDQSTAPSGKVRFKDILAQIAGRLHRSPVFRQKLLRVPLEMDYPYWVEDEHFDLEYHVRHIALPKPGDWRQFCIQASRIHARPLDLNRPLWEIYVIEGLDSFLDLPQGSFALLTKIHHAAINVEHSSEITMLLHDTSPSASPPAPPAPWFPESAPGRLSLALRGAAHTITSPLRLARPLAHAIRRVGPAALSLAGSILRNEEDVPVTRFNTEVSPHRVFDTRRFTLDEFRAIRSLIDRGTVSEAVLAVCGGALRRYLQAEEELPDSSLMSIAPIFKRDPRDPARRPEVNWVRIKLGTDIADPVARLRLIHEQALASAEVQSSIGFRELARIGENAPASTLAITSKMMGRLSLGLGRRAPLANCMITNVPGPSVPLYLCGARMTYFSAIMPIVDGMGLVFAVTSYDGRLIISPTSCRELIPDPEAFTQCIRDSFQEYLALALARPKARATAKPARSKEGATAKPARKVKPKAKVERAAVKRTAAVVRKPDKAAAARRAA